MFLGDLHIHSTFSGGKLSIPEIVDLYGKKGFGAIAITDRLCESDTVIGKASVYMNRTLTSALFPIYLEILKSEAKRAWDQYRMVVIPGVELTKGTGLHGGERIIGLGITDFIDANGDVIQLAKQIHAQGGIVIGGHPAHTKFSTGASGLWERRRELASVIDAWEVSVGKRVFKRVLRSRFPKLASSGFHDARHLNSWKTVFFGERSQASVLEAIRTQNLGFMFYEQESYNDVHGWIDLGALGRDELDNHIRNLVVPASLSRRARVGTRKVIRAAGFARLFPRFHSEAAQRRRQRAAGESRKLFSNRVSKI